MKAEMKDVTFFLCTLFAGFFGGVFSGLVYHQAYPPKYPITQEDVWLLVQAKIAGNAEAMTIYPGLISIRHAVQCQGEVTAIDCEKYDRNLDNYISEDEVVQRFKDSMHPAAILGWLKWCETDPNVARQLRKTYGS